MPDFAPGTFCWADLMPVDQARAISFYAGLAGWTASVGGPEYGGYALAYDGADQSPANTTAGFNPPMEGAPTGWSVYLATADLDESLDAVAALGGAVVVGRMDIPGMGAMAMCTEPTGAMFGLWEPGGHSGFGVFGEAGGFCWTEVYSTDAKVTRDFFVSLFELDARTLSETDEFTYFQVAASPSAEPAFGVMQLGPTDAAGNASSSTFAVYLFVSGVDEAAEAAVASGAAITQPAMDTPFGRMATLTDSEGASIKIVDPPLATTGAM